MHVRIRMTGKPDTVVVVNSRLTKIDQFRLILKAKFHVEPNLQRLIYGGKLLENGCTFHDYKIKLNDVIQLMVRAKSEDNHKEKTDAETEDTKQKQPEEPKQEQPEATKNIIEYKDAESTLYKVGDLIDMRHQQLGSWFEGKIIRVVYDPAIPNIPHIKEMSTNGAEVLTSYNKSNLSSDIENDVENKPPSESTNGGFENSNQSSDKDTNVENKPPSKSTNGDSLSKKKYKDIASFFIKTSKAVPKKEMEKKDFKAEEPKDLNTLLLYKVKWNIDDEEASHVYCKLKDIRPRARKEIDIKDLKVGMKVMLNYNVDLPKELGHWYDFQVEEIIEKMRLRSHELIGTIYLGPDAIPQNATRLSVLDKVYAIEEVVPLAQRTKEYSEIIAKAPEKRTSPLKCYTCRDNDDMACKDCGCYSCAGKECPDQIILCDECDKGYHMFCLKPPLTEVPDEDWYCLHCKRDPNAVVAPGKAMQTRKASRTSRDWGRGMACVGKTKDCSMPANHFGPIPGIEVGMCWRFRIQLSESGVHRPPVSGIHGRDVEGAYSLVLSGGYEDDVDHGYEFTYTGSGGRDLSGNKRTAEQSSDQKLLRENKALARNCAVHHISEEGGDAGDSWRSGKPVRVVRSYKMNKHFPKYAPQEGIRYDGIYKVVKYYPETGKSGFRVWKYLLRRDDPSPAPWEPGVQEYPLVYPDGYLEAEAEKKALKEQHNDNGNGGTDKIKKKRKRRALKENNETAHSDGEDSPLATKRSRKLEPPVLVPDTKATNFQKKKIPSKLFAKNPLKKPIPSNLFTKNPLKKSNRTKSVESALNTEQKEAIEADTLNSKLWNECLVVCDTRGKKEFVEHVTQAFICNICQAVAVRPVTTPCLHNFCMGCIKLACKSGAQCPCCRQSLQHFNIEPNEQLQKALRSIMAGYDAGNN